MTTRSIVEDCLRDVRSGRDLPVDPSTSLSESGWLDSLAFVGLITFLSERFGIVIEDEDLTPENFDTIDGIVDYVARSHARTSTGRGA